VAALKVAKAAPVYPFSGGAGFGRFGQAAGYAKCKESCKSQTRVPLLLTPRAGAEEEAAGRRLAVLPHLQSAARAAAALTFSGAAPCRPAIRSGYGGGCSRRACHRHLT
jgi:hypothetical protein